VQQRKTKDTISNHKNKNNKNNKTCENYDPINLELSYTLKHTTTEGAVATERERQITLTAIHFCHRTGIPFGHVLIELLCGLKHCKKQEERRVQQKKRKAKPRTQTTTKKSRFKPQTKKQEQKV